MTVNGITCARVNPCVMLKVKVALVMAVQYFAVLLYIKAPEYSGASP